MNYEKENFDNLALRAVQRPQIQSWQLSLLALSYLVAAFAGGVTLKYR